MSVLLRPVLSDDDDFLKQVYASTREEELLLYPWTVDQKNQFIQMQYLAQKTHYTKYFINSEHHVILYNNTPVGRLMVEERENEIRIIDIAILTIFRKKGIGTYLMKGLIKRTMSQGKPLTLNVFKQNMVKEWYESLGMQSVSDDGMYVLMKYNV